MALTAVTVPSTPTTAQINAALASVNAYITDALAEVTVGANVILDRFRLTDGNNSLMLVLEAAIVAFSSTSHADVNVVDTTPGVSNTALASISGYVDLVSANTNTMFGALREHLKRTNGKAVHLTALDLARTNIGSPAVLTAQTVAINPIDKTEMDTALAATIVFIDTLNSEASALLTAFVEPFRLNPGNAILSLRLDNAITTLA